MASVLDVGRECGKASSAALVFEPCDSCPSTFYFRLVKHPLQWFCVDLSVSFHLLCRHGQTLLHVYRFTALVAENALIFDQFVGMWITCG
jgi:hypothetical protein